MTFFQSISTFASIMLLFSATPSLTDALQNHHHQHVSHHLSYRLPSQRVPSSHPPPPPSPSHHPHPHHHAASQMALSSSRRGFLMDAVAKTATAAALIALLSPSMLVRAAHANDDVSTVTIAMPVSSSSSGSSKKILSDEALKEIILSDIMDRQFLVTGQLTLSAYEPTAKWQDEIDTYEIKTWVTGTEKLFVGDQSSVRLVGDINVTPERVEFRFDEDLMFRLPFSLRPVVHLTGRVVLDRNPETGLVSFGREIWDDSVATVLQSAKF